MNKIVTDMNGYHPLGSVKLIQSIIDQIEAAPEKAISFHDYMELCLYHPQWGYYTSTRIKIGKEGDFYTSSSIGSILGEVLAKRIVDLHHQDAETKGDPLVSLLEWGGGTGQLAKHILDEIKLNFPQMYEIIEYTVIEQSPYHQEIQQESLYEHLSRVKIISSADWFERGRRNGTIVLSNELLDAFPVHRVIFAHNVIQEIYVAWDNRRQVFYEKLVLLENKEVMQFIRDNEVTFREGQRGEVNLAGPSWIKQIGEWMESGSLITIDYGDVSKELYAEHRMNGTLMCYCNHQAYDNPYIRIGQQDITAHVNFTALQHAGQMVGLTAESLQTQKDFLVQGGILQKLQNHFSSDPFDPIAKRNRAIRQILISDRMSELFKVLIQTKKRN